MGTKRRIPTRGFGRSRAHGLVNANKAESSLRVNAERLGVELSRRGYPDYAVIVDGEIVGFIEVKPRPWSNLKIAQVAFKKLCDKHGIPFRQWDPTKPLPEFFLKAVRNV